MITIAKLTSNDGIQWRLQYAGICTDDLPNLTSATSAFILAEMILTGCHDWRKSLKDDRRFDTALAHFKTKKNNKVPLGLVSYAAANMIAMRYMELAMSAGVLRDPMYGELPVDYKKYEAAYASCLRGISRIQRDRLNYETIGIDEVSSMWFDRLLPAIKTWNPQDLKEDAGPSDPNLMAEDHTSATVLAAIRMELGREFERTGKAISIDEIYAEALALEALNDANGKHAPVYMDLNDGTVHLDYKGIARSFVESRLGKTSRRHRSEDQSSQDGSKGRRKRPSIHRTVSIDEALMKTLADAKAPEVNFDASHDEGILNNARDELDLAIADDLSMKAALEYLTRKQSDEDQSPTRKEIAAEFGISLRSFKHGREKLNRLLQGFQRELES